MNRIQLAIAFGLLCIAMFAVMMARGSNRDLLPFLGRWTGGFQVARVSSGMDTSEDRKRESTRGYVQIYASNRKFLLHLEGEQETMDLAGTWRRTSPQRILLHFLDFKIDDAGGAQTRNPNMKYVPPAELRAAYAHDLVLDRSPDGKQLTGLLMTVGPLEGTHTFVR